MTEIIHQLFSDAKERGCAPIFFKHRDISADKLSLADDIDILCTAEIIDDFVELMVAGGFVEIESSPWRAIKHVRDFFAYHTEHEKLLHIQLYSDLVLGAPACSQLLLTNSSASLATDQRGIFSTVAMPDKVVVDLLSASLYAPYNLKRQIKHYRRYKQSVKHCTTAEIQEACTRILQNESLTQLVLAALKSRSLISSLLKLSEISKFLKHNTTTIYLPAPPFYKLYSFLSGINRRSFNYPVLPRRKLKHPSRIAVIGSDGSGKPTISKFLTNTLKKKIDVKHIYFGTGDGPKVEDTARTEDSLTTKHKQKDKHNYPNDIARAVLAISAALERRAKCKSMQKASNSGFIVITDRYPQTTHHGIHDGPRLAGWKDSGIGLKASLAKWEYSIYEKITEIVLDVIILLDVDLETAAKRGPEEPQSALKKRIDVIQKVKINTEKYTKVDSTQPTKQVKSSVMNTLLCALPESANGPV